MKTTQYFRYTRERPDRAIIKRLEVKSLYKKQEYFTLAPHASAGEHKGHKACTEPAEVYTKVFKVFLRDLCALRVQIFFGSSELGSEQNIK